MHLPLTPRLGVLILPCLSLSGSETASAVLPITTRQQTIRPVALPLGTPAINPREVALYRERGYSAWQLAPGEDQGSKLDLMPAGYAASPNAAQLLSFFSFSDVHITDKESPSQVPYFGWSANFGAATLGLYSQAYSPVMLSTPQVLDATVRTVNALHAQTPFDFGVVLGDVANSSQFNELRWFIDVMDGQYIEPSSGDHQGAGADTQIAGFVIAGEGTKKIVVRGVGPGLAPGVTGYLADPTRRLWKLHPTTGTWTLVAANDNWGGASTLKTAFLRVGMGALAADSKDAALMVELEPGIYTAQVNGVGGTTGVALVEAYELP